MACLTTFGYFVLVNVVRYIIHGCHGSWWWRLLARQAPWNVSSCCLVPCCASQLLVLMASITSLQTHLAPRSGRCDSTQGTFCGHWSSSMMNIWIYNFLGFDHQWVPLNTLNLKLWDPNRNLCIEFLMIWTPLKWWGSVSTPGCGSIRVRYVNSVLSMCLLGDSCFVAL